jgi:hypothetical protein
MGKCLPNAKVLRSRIAENLLCQFAFCLLLLLLFVSGCGEIASSPQGVTETGFDLSAIEISDFAGHAVIETGGLAAWSKAGQVISECVVTFYNQDGTHYLTEQIHSITPLSNTIDVIAQEPEGAVKWSLSGGQLTGENGKAFLPKKLSAKGFVDAVLKINNAPLILMDRNLVFEKRADAEKIEGVWHFGIVQAADKNWSEVVFYQNRDNSLVDMVWLADKDERSFFLVRGYNYGEVEKGGIHLPDRIEIFKTDSTGTVISKLAKVDYH